MGRLRFRQTLGANPGRAATGGSCTERYSTYPILTKTAAFAASRTRAHRSSRSPSSGTLISRSGRHRHKWQAGDLVIWDNRCTVHRATPFAATDHVRDMRRTTIIDRALDVLVG